MQSTALQYASRYQAREVFCDPAGYRSSPNQYPEFEVVLEPAAGEVGAAHERKSPVSYHGLRVQKHLQRKTAARAARVMDGVLGK